MVGDRSTGRHACSWSNNFISLLIFILRVHPGQLDYVDQVVVCLQLYKVHGYDPVAHGW